MIATPLRADFDAQQLRRVAKRTRATVAILEVGRMHQQLDQPPVAVLHGWAQ